jgi:hypothetical protein
MRKGLLTVTATHGEKLGRLRRGVGYGELELEVTRGAGCLDVRIYRTGIDDWVWIRSTHRAVLVEESKNGVAKKE